MDEEDEDDLQEIIWAAERREFRKKKFFSLCVKTKMIFKMLHLKNEGKIHKYSW